MPAITFTDLTTLIVHNHPEIGNYYRLSTHSDEGKYPDTVKLTTISITCAYDIHERYDVPLGMAILATHKAVHALLNGTDIEQKEASQRRLVHEYLEKIITHPAVQAYTQERLTELREATLERTELMKKRLRRKTRRW